MAAVVLQRPGDEAEVPRRVIEARRTLSEAAFGALIAQLAQLDAPVQAG
jgi:hypothetical protein